MSVRRTIALEDAGDRAVVRDTATATFEGEGFPLDRLTGDRRGARRCEAFDTSDASHQGGTQRFVSVRERPEVQEVLRLWL